MSGEFFKQFDLEEPIYSESGQFSCSVFCRGNPYGEGPNEDAVASFALSENEIVFLLADGAGGYPKGEEASQLAIASVIEQLKKLETPVRSGSLVRNAILDGIERGNRKLLQKRTGSCTTLTICHWRDHKLRTYHIGDSELILCGSRGKLKYRTMPHSPVGFGVEAGLIEESEALDHPNRHVLTNVVGSQQMTIDLGPIIKVVDSDTLLMGSDGLFDNFTVEELIEVVRVGTAQATGEELVKKYLEKFSESSESELMKPDDLSFLLCKLSSSGGCDNAPST